MPCRRRGRQAYLLHAAELVYGALVMLHAVFSKVQVSGVLGETQDSVEAQPLGRGTLSVLTRDSDASGYKRQYVLEGVGQTTAYSRGRRDLLGGWSGTRHISLHKQLLEHGTDGTPGKHVQVSDIVPPL